MNIVKRPEFTQEDIDLCVEIMDMIEALVLECEIDEVEDLGRKLNLKDLHQKLDIFTGWIDNTH